VGDADGEALGDAVGELVVAGRVDGTGVVVGVGAVRSGRGGATYGPLSAPDTATPTTIATTKHTGASTVTRSRRIGGRTHSSKRYHNDPANTTISATDSHHGKPRMNGPWRTIRHFDE
jgi:hypothetical protein